MTEKMDINKIVDVESLFHAQHPTLLLTLGHRGLRPRKPLPAERARGRGVFHGIARFAGLARGWLRFALAASGALPP